MSLSRRAFLSSAIASAALWLAGCGQAGAPALPSSAAPSAPASASPKPAGSSAGSAAASAKPAGSAAASAAPSVKPAAPGTANAVKGAWVAITGNMMLWPVALEAGYFDKYGVNFNLQYIQGSVTSVTAMLAGDLDMASISGSTVVAAQAVKQDIIMVVGYVGEYFWRLLAKPDITSLDQLRGKTIAVTKVGNSDYFAWSILANKMGWKLEDFKFAPANDAPGQVTLFQSGQADALAVSPPNDVLALKAGAHQVLDEADYHLPNQAVGMTFPRGYLAKNRPVALNVAKATVEAIKRWKDDPAFAKQVMQKYLKQDDPDYLNTGYDAWNRLFQTSPFPSAPGFASCVDEVSNQTPAAKDVKPEQCFDSGIMQELQDSGFLKQIFG